MNRQDAKFAKKSYCWRTIIFPLGAIVSIGSIVVKMFCGWLGIYARP